MLPMLPMLATHSLLRRARARAPVVRPRHSHQNSSMQPFDCQLSPLRVLAPDTPTPIIAIPSNAIRADEHPF